MTDVSASLEPGLESGSLGVRAAAEARLPPAELPPTNSTAGSAPYSSPWSRTQAIAFFTSTRWSGNRAAGLRR